MNTLIDGCALKAGVAPERFTFEQRANIKAQTSQEDAKPRKKIELLGPENFPSDVDPHVLPEQSPAGASFDWNQRRY